MDAVDVRIRMHCVSHPTTVHDLLEGRSMTFRIAYPLEGGSVVTSNGLQRSYVHGHGSDTRSTRDHISWHALRQDAS